MDNQIVEYLGNVDFAKGRRFLIDGVEREELIATKLMILTRSISPDLARHVDQWAADRTARSPTVRSSWRSTYLSIPIPQ
jgi:hypothetical protein